MRGRRLLNEEEIARIASEQGFEIIRAEELGFRKPGDAVFGGISYHRPPRIRFRQYGFLLLEELRLSK